MKVDSRVTAYINTPLPDFIINWAKQVGIMFEASNCYADYELSFRENKLQLSWLGKENFSSVFVEMPTVQRMATTNLLIKAMGKKAKVIADLTPGLGRDAMTLAASGKHVYCIERCAPIALLLFDGLRRCPETISKRINFEFGDSLNWLEQRQNKFDTVYIDTMFSIKKKSAKAPKVMQILRVVAGDDLDARLLFSKALNSDANRIVVKHADDAEVDKDRLITQYKGKTVRFDVYKP